MTKSLTIAIALALTGCYQGYYVADVHPAGDGLVVTKCAIDLEGRATRSCHDELEDGAGDGAGTPDPAEISAAERRLEAQQPRPLPAPDERRIAKAFVSPGVTRLLELCRRTYAADAAELQFAVTVNPSGDIADLTPRAANPRFAGCAERALRTASIAAFDGSPVHLEQRVAL
jgi:hypothetical protein